MVKPLLILTSPNPYLSKTTNSPVDISKIEQYHKTVDEMIQLMILNNGVGLAAPQVGIDETFFVVKADNNDLVAIFNPHISWVSPNKTSMEEGCLSFPDLVFKVSRPESIVASWYNHLGEFKEEKLTGMNARIFLHEYDHCLGVCFTDRISKLTLDMAVKRAQKQSRRKPQSQSTKV